MATNINEETPPNNDFIAYESEEEAGLNDVYENLPSDESIESSDGFPTEGEEEETEEGEVTESEDDEEVEPKNGKFRDPSHDPYREWRRIADIPEHKIDIQAAFLDDPDLKDMWADQAVSEETEDSEDDYDENDMDEIFEVEKEVKHRSDDEEDEDNTLNSSDDDSDEGPTPLVEADTPIPLLSDDADDDKLNNGEGSQVNYEEQEEETEEESDFSIATEPEEEDDDNQSVVENENGDDENEGQEGADNEEDEEEEEEDEEEIRKRKYRKVEKEKEDDTTEWETITQPSENEAPELEGEAEEGEGGSDDNEDEVEQEDENMEEDEDEEVIEEIPKTPDPYGYTELHTNIEHIEEFDGGFMDKFKARIKTSAGSSEDESGLEHAQGDFDVHTYTLEEHKAFSVIKAAKNYKNPNEETPRRRKLSKRPNRLVSENTSEKMEKKKSKGAKMSKISTKNHQKEKYIDLSVYDFHIPQFNSNDELLAPEKPVVEEQSAKPVKKKRKEKVKKLKRRGFLNSTYERCHQWYADVLKLPETENPSAAIPSYKVQARSRTIKERTVKLALDKVLNQALKAIDDIEQLKLRKEANHNCQFLLLQLADDVVGEIEEQQQRNAVRFTIEVLLDKWEEHVYTTQKDMIEEQFNTLSEKLVTNAISKVSREVENEDRVASLIVRDAFAGSLDSLGKSRPKIQRKLNQLFSEYRFDEYNFVKGETKIKQKLHRTRRALDSNLKNRRKQEIIETTPPRGRSAKRRQRGQTKHLSQIEEDENSTKEENLVLEENTKLRFDKVKDDSEEDLNERDLIDLPSEALSEGEEEIRNDAPVSIDKFNKILDRERRRSHVLKIWKEKDQEILTQLREENEHWNSMYEQQQIEKEKLEQEKPQDDLNALYAMTDEDEKNENKSETDELFLEDKRMPNLEEVVQEALVNREADILIVPVKQGFKRAPPTDNEDSAVESSEENKKGEYESGRQRKSVVIVREPIFNRRDTGISSLATFEEPLVGQEIENESSSKDLINLIPNIDRDQFLKDWLFRSGQQQPASALCQPTPPSGKKRERTRRFHLKRPGTADSQASVRDIVPLDNMLLAHYSGRLNSAKSTRSVQRPESAQSMYSERSSIYSRLEERAPSPDMESDEDEKQNKSQGGRQAKPKNTKIEYHKAKEKEKISNEKFEKDIENSAWNFYVRQNRDLRKLQEKIEQEGRPELLSDIVLPSCDFEDKDFDNILDKYGTIKINGMYEEEEGEIELLNLMNDEKDKNSSAEENEKDLKAPSVSPPSTPWKRQKNRPLTPDSVDSDEELEKIKSKHYNMHKSKNNGPGQPRLYKEFLRKKDTSLPPPPKLGWQPPSDGLIKWKNVSEDMKKVNKGRRKGGKTQQQDASLALKRALFNQLQLSLKKSERQKMVHDKRLLQRRATLHTEQLTLTNLEKRKKILPKNVDPRSISPRSTRSIPSYARPTKAATLKKRKDKDDKDKEDIKLPNISSKSNKSHSSKSIAFSSRRKSTKPATTAR